MFIRCFVLPLEIGTNETNNDSYYITPVLIDDAMSLVPEFEFGIQPMLGAEKAQLICIYHNTHFPTVPSMTRVYLGRGKTRHMLCRQPTIKHFNRTASTLDHQATRYQSYRTLLQYSFYQ